MTDTGAKVDTIAAIATAPGPSAIGIVRLSGPDSREILSAIVPDLPDAPEPRRVYTGWAVDPRSGERIDRVVALVFEQASSYTGEQAAEIQGHGGPLVMDGLLNATLSAGARLAQPGEFTRRAFLNGRLDLAQAEAVALVVSARSRRAARAALHQLAGGLGEVLLEARAPLHESLVALEGCLDFSEHDVPEPHFELIADNLERSRRRLVRLRGTWESGKRIFDGIRVVLAGPPNAGKSSLFNRILGKIRAIVDDEPGTTRDYLEASTRLDGLHVTMVDTAGLRSLAPHIENRGIEMSRQAISGADVVLLVLDGAGIDAGSLAELTASSGELPIVVALNKCDLGRHPDRETLEMIEPFARFELSAVTGEGIERMLDHIVTEAVSATDTQSALVTCTRHRDLIARAIDDIDRSRSAIDKGHPADVMASTIRVAMGRIDEITGRDVVEEVLDDIFSSFCIGK